MPVRQTRYQFNHDVDHTIPPRAYTMQFFEDNFCGTEEWVSGRLAITCFVPETRDTRGRLIPITCLEEIDDCMMDIISYIMN